MKISLILLISSFTFAFNLIAQTTDLKKKASKEFNKNYTKFQIKGSGIGYNEVFLGDMTGDGKIDAVVYYALTPKDGGNAFLGNGIVVYANNNGIIKEVTAFKPNFRFIVKEIMDNKLHIIKLEYAKDDAPDFPSIETLKYFILKGNKLQESITY